MLLTCSGNQVGLHHHSNSARGEGGSVVLFSLIRQMPRQHLKPRCESLITRWQHR